MKSLTTALLTMSLFSAVVLAINNQFQTRFITSATLTIHVKDGVFLTIRKFTQDQPVKSGERGVIVVGVPPPTPTPTPAPIPTPTPITTRLLTAAITSGSSASPTETIKPIIIAGPAVLTIEPVRG